MRANGMTGSAWRIGSVAVLSLALAGCATTFEPQPLVTPDELRDVKSKAIGEVGVSVSILTDLSLLAMSCKSIPCSSNHTKFHIEGGRNDPTTRSTDPQT